MSSVAQTGLSHIVVFALEEPRYALPLSAVERIIRWKIIVLINDLDQ